MALARADGDASRLAEIAARARARLGDLAEEVARLFGDEEWSSELTVDIALRLSRARYYDNLVADAERASP
jgi:molecular chaperone HscB